MARLAQCLKTVIDKPARANRFPWNYMVNVIPQRDPPRQLARLAQWLFGQLPRPYRLPNRGFVFPIIGPFGLVDPGRGGMINTQ
jgi:hypothetical protein